MLNLKIKTKNAAFTDTGDPRPELARILRATAELIEQELQKEFKVNVLDITGNTVGTLTLSK